MQVPFVFYADFEAIIKQLKRTEVNCSKLEQVYWEKKLFISLFRNCLRKLSIVKKIKIHFKKRASNDKRKEERSSDGWNVICIMNCRIQKMFELEINVMWQINIKVLPTKVVILTFDRHLIYMLYFTILEDMIVISDARKW